MSSHYINFISNLLLFHNPPSMLRRTRPHLSAARSRGFRVRALDHVCVVVTSIDRSIEWYNSVLGLKHEFETNPNFGIAQHLSHFSRSQTLKFQAKTQHFLEVVMQKLHSSR